MAKFPYPTCPCLSCPSETEAYVCQITQMALTSSVCVDEGKPCQRRYAAIRKSSSVSVFSFSSSMDMWRVRCDRLSTSKPKASCKILLSTKKFPKCSLTNILPHQYSCPTRWQAWQKKSQSSLRCSECVREKCALIYVYFGNNLSHLGMNLK